MQSINVNYQDISYSFAILGLSLTVGAYPTQQQINNLIKDGYSIFIDLTNKNEVNNHYILPKNLIYINYPIYDRRVPSSLIDFIMLVRTINNLSNNKIYIHCRGGHGRASVLAVCLCLYRIKMANITLNNDIYATILADIYDLHQNRKIMDDRWRKLGVPQTRSQRDFCLTFYNHIKVENV